MACTTGISAYIRSLTFSLGIFVQLRGPRFACAEVELTGSLEKAIVGSPFEMRCSFIGLQPITGFEMSLNNESAISALDNCRILLEPNSTLYEYNCPSKTELKLIIKDIGRDNDGDIWTCQVFFSDQYESTTYTISVYDGQKKTTLGTTEILKRAENRERTTAIISSTKGSFAMTGNTRKHDHKTAIYVGVALGAFCLALLIYSVVVTVLLTKKKCRRDTKPIDQTATRSTYVNVGDKSNVTAPQGRASPNERVDLNECTEASAYTDLNAATRGDTEAYSGLQTHGVTAEQGRACPHERVDLNHHTEASAYTDLNAVTRDDTEAYSDLQTHNV